jgi:hypothetical protein
MSAPEFVFPGGLTPEERELLAELLEAERHRLLLEIRHTDHRQFREQLAHRYDMVEQLTAKMRQPAHI